MKHITLLFLCTFVLLLSCSKKEENGATEYIERINNIAISDEQQALNLIDTIHILFPRDVASRRCADTLKWQIEYRQSVRSLEYIDSMVAVCNEAIPQLVKPFKHTKNEKYQDIGTFEHNILRTENNTARCYLKPTTDEHGKLMLTSYYVGKKANHNQFSVTIDSLTVLSSVADDASIYSFVDLDTFNETIIFDQELDRSVFKFIADNSDKRIKITLLGASQEYIYYLNSNEKRAITQTYELGVMLYDFMNYTNLQLNTSQKIENYKRKLNIQ